MVFRGSPYTSQPGRATNAMRRPGSRMTGMMADTRPRPGQVTTLPHGRPPITKPWPGPGGGGTLAPGPSPGYGQAPMTADEANEWLNAGNYTGGGYATIQSLLAAENARRWGDAPGEAPAGNQLNFGEITPGSKGKHWTWGPPPGAVAAGGGAPAGPLIDPVSGQPLETPDGRPIYNPNPTAPPGGGGTGGGNLGNDVNPMPGVEPWAIPNRRPIYNTNTRRRSLMRPMGRSNTYIT
jgi:hypothetical protein